jgi:hypothetical protein
VKALTQLGGIFTLRLVAKRRPADSDRSAGSLFAHRETLPQLAHDLPPCP